MEHFARLKKMYSLAPIHKFYEGIELEIEGKKSKVSLPIDTRYFHGGMAIHGSVYFKLLDDAAYFACQSVVTDFFLVTTTFNINLLKPIKEGKIYAIGEVDFTSLNVFKGYANLYDERGRLCGTGRGQFVKSKLKLETVKDY